MSDNLRVCAQRVWDVAKRQPIMVTDDVSGSTQLVGFFVPAVRMSDLGRALSSEVSTPLIEGPEIKFLPLYQDEPWTFWELIGVGAVIGVVLSIVIVSIVFWLAS